MTRFAVRFGVAVIAAALASATAADADTLVRKKKSNFLERLFGSSATTSNRQKPRRNLFGNGWFRRDRSYGDVQIIYGGSDLAQESPRLRQLPAVAGDDPEGEVNLVGMGNLTYGPDKLVPLGGNKMDSLRPAGVAESAIFDALISNDLGFRVSPEVRRAMLGHYIIQGFRPIWIQNGALAPRGKAVLDLLAAADEDGLQASAYMPPVLQSFDAADQQALARLDLGITAMALKYAYDASGGRFDPRRLSLYHDITPEHVDPLRALNVLAWSPFPDAYLRDLHPKHPAYAVMKKELAELRKEFAEKTFAAIPDGNRVKLGQSDERLEAVRERLSELDISVAESETPSKLDKGLAAALKQFQKSAGLKVTGNLDNPTVKALNGHYGGQHNIRRLTYNMERLRWLPKDLGRRNVFVNQAAFQVQVNDGSTAVWRSDVIVGKPMSQTAVFNDEIETVVFNPSWGVPQSIVASEYLPKLWDDPFYLDRIGFKVSTPSGEVVPSGDIDWNYYGRLVPYSIQQPPGPKNALGELKFLFPNSHNIYMHDTPNRELFAEQSRAFSHGCIRVENPRVFATVLLNWSKDKVDSTVDSGKTQTIRLPRKMPVHIAYFTAWPDESGKMMYYKDIYGRDEAMEKAMSAITLAQR